MFDIELMVFVVVRVEAEKIRLWQYFAFFRDFDRCKDSYGVIHNRATAKYATKYGYAVRVCSLWHDHPSI